MDAMSGQCNIMVLLRLITFDKYSQKISIIYERRCSKTSKKTFYLGIFMIRAAVTEGIM